MSETTPRPERTAVERHTAPAEPPGGATRPTDDTAVRAGGVAAAGVPPRARLEGAQPARLVVPLVVGAVLWFIPPPSGVESSAWHLLAIFAATIVGIIAKPLPMGAVAVLGIAATVLTGTLELEDALSGFSNAVIWLIVLAFFIARGFIKTGLGTRIAYLFVSVWGKKTLGLSYGLAITDLVMAPAIPSNTARAGGVIFPILRSLSSTYGSEPNDPSARRVGSYLTVTAFQVNCVTSAMFLTAMAANPLAAELADGLGVQITWGRWALAALMPGLVSLAVLPLLLYKLYPPEVKETPAAAEQARQRLAEMGPMSIPEKVMLATFLVLLALWTAGDQLLGIISTTAALVGLGILLVSGVLTWGDVISEKSAWDTLVWFAALVMMATFLNELGLIPWFSERMSGAVSGLGWIPAFVILTLVYFYAHYLFASNTAHVSAMYAAFLGTAIAAGAPPMFSALVLAFESSLFAAMTHYGSGPAPVLFGAGYVPLAKWWGLGAIVSVVNIAIWTTVGGAWMKLLGLW